jgi:hypothetical protein
MPMFDEFVNELVSEYNIAKSKGAPITQPSIPILFFGDLINYLDSEVKIITVGLNPSHKEFPPDSRFSRFIGADKLDMSSKLSEQDVISYLSALNMYFHFNPYRKWFGSFEPILNGLNSSYYPENEANTVLHTDLCSPYATDITWSKLNVRYRNVLRSPGIKIWHKLLEFLEPNIVLISVSERYLRTIKFRINKWKTHTTIMNKDNGTPRAKPYTVKKAGMKINDKKGYIVWGKAAQTPFGTLSKNIKKNLGKSLLDLL